MKPGILLSIVIALPVSSTFGSDEAELTNAQEHLASLYDSTIRDAIVLRLADSGLSSNDVESLVDAAMESYAGCTIDALGKIDNPAATVFLTSMKDGLSAADLDTRLREVDDSYFVDFFVALNAFTEPCRLDVDSRLGIPIKN